MRHGERPGAGFALSHENRRIRKRITVKSPGNGLIMSESQSGLLYSKYSNGRSVFSQDNRINLAAMW